MPALAILPDPASLRLVKITTNQSLISIIASSSQHSANCPACSQPSSRIHSRYERNPADLPWLGIPADLRLQVRRFFCDNPSCKRRIFCERFPDLIAPYAHCTFRLNEIERTIGFTSGGERGSKLAKRLGINVSADTLLRRIRQTPQPTCEATRVLGVDDWAMRKGQRYGTILVDLERRAVIGLLADRTCETLESWLKAHPGIEIISRDRAPAYAEAASKGAPLAEQVADRFHLLKNLAEALERVLLRHHCQLSIAAKAVDAELTRASCQTDLAPLQTVSVDAEPSTLLSRIEREKQMRRDLRLTRYNQVAGLYEQGMRKRQIARELTLSRNTVRRYLRAGSFPERARPRRRPSSLDAFAENLREKWKAGCHNAAQLWRELRAMGFKGSAGIVRRYVASLRDPSIKRRGKKPAGKKKAEKVNAPSPRQAVWLMIGKEEKLGPEQKAVRDKIYELCPEAKQAATQALKFQEMVRDRAVEKLDGWMEEASKVSLELKSFATGLQRDRKAVEAALTMEWSNGQVEGQVNKLKLLKREMYGRAKLDLLRQRMMHGP